MTARISDCSGEDWRRTHLFGWFEKKGQLWSPFMARACSEVGSNLFCKILEGHHVAWPTMRAALQVFSSVIEENRMQPEVTKGVLFPLQKRLETSLRLRLEKNFRASTDEQHRTKVSQVQINQIHRNVYSSMHKWHENSFCLGIWGRKQHSGMPLGCLFESNSIATQHSVVQDWIGLHWSKKNSLVQACQKWVS